MTKTKPAVKKVTKKKVVKSKFEEKDFDFNKFPSVQNNENKKHIDNLVSKAYVDKVTAFPYEIDGEPVVEGCTKWQFMLVVVVLALCLVATSYGDFTAVTSNLTH